MGEGSLVGAVTAEDYVAAVQLFAAYGRAIDTGAPTDEIMGLLAEDPVIVTPGDHRFEGAAACRALVGGVVERLHRSSSSVQHRYSDVCVSADGEDLAATANLLTCSFISMADVVFGGLAVEAGDRYELSQRVQARLVRGGGGLVFAEKMMIGLWARVDRGAVDLTGQS